MNYAPRIRLATKAWILFGTLNCFNVFAQVSNGEGLKPLEGVSTKRQTTIESSDTLREDKFWEDVKSVGNKKAYEAYIKNYPKGRYVDLAKANIDRFSAKELNPAKSKTKSKFEELEAAATKAKDEAPSKLKKEAPEATRFEKNYFQIKKELRANISGSKKVMVVQLAVMTHYDNRVFDNINKHEFALRSALLDKMRQFTDSEASKPEFPKELAVKLKDVMNAMLEEYEDFGGIEEVMFTSFELL
jgi:flagellar FliL protein